MAPLPHAVSSDHHVNDMLASIVRFTQDDLPFLSRVAQLALQATSRLEREQALVSLYRLGLEHNQPYVSDLVDELLCWMERSTGDAA